MAADKSGPYVEPLLYTEPLRALHLSADVSQSLESFTPDGNMQCFATGQTPPETIAFRPDLKDLNLWMFNESDSQFVRERSKFLTLSVLFKQAVLACRHCRRDLKPTTAVYCIWCQHCMCAQGCLPTLDMTATPCMVCSNFARFCHAEWIAADKEQQRRFMLAAVRSNIYATQRLFAVFGGLTGLQISTACVQVAKLDHLDWRHEKPYEYWLQSYNTVGYLTALKCAIMIGRQLDVHKKDVKSTWNRMTAMSADQIDVLYKQPWSTSEMRILDDVAELDADHTIDDVDAENDVENDLHDHNLSANGTTTTCNAEFWTEEKLQFVHVTDLHHWIKTQFQQRFLCKDDCVAFLLEKQAQSTIPLDPGFNIRIMTELKNAHRKRRRIVNDGMKSMLTKSKRNAKKKIKVVTDTVADTVTNTVTNTFTDTVTDTFTNTVDNHVIDAHNGNGHDDVPDTIGNSMDEQPDTTSENAFVDVDDTGQNATTHVLEPVTETEAELVAANSKETVSGTEYTMGTSIMGTSIMGTSIIVKSFFTEFAFISSMSHFDDMILSIQQALQSTRNEESAFESAFQLCMSNALLLSQSNEPFWSTMLCVPRIFTEPTYGLAPSASSDLKLQYQLQANLKYNTGIMGMFYDGEHIDGAWVYKMHHGARVMKHGHISLVPSLATFVDGSDTTTMLLFLVPVAVSGNVRDTTKWWLQSDVQISLLVPAMFTTVTRSHLCAKVTVCKNIPPALLWSLLQEQFLQLVATYTFLLQPGEDLQHGMLAIPARGSIVEMQVAMFNVLYSPLMESTLLDGKRDSKHDNTFAWRAMANTFADTSMFMMSDITGFDVNIHGLKQHRNNDSPELNVICDLLAGATYNGMRLSNITFLRNSILLAKLQAELHRLLHKYNIQQIIDRDNVLKSIYSHFTSMSTLNGVM
jgi:hypothetical protein